MPTDKINYSGELECLAQICEVVNFLQVIFVNIWNKIFCMQNNLLASSMRCWYLTQIAECHKKFSLWLNYTREEVSYQLSHRWIPLLVHREKMARNTWNSGQNEKKSLSKEKIKRPWQDGCPVQVEGVETNFSPLPSHTFTLKHFPVTLLHCHRCTKASGAWKQSLCQSCHVSQNRQAAAL